MPRSIHSLLAKGARNGTISLIDHTEHVSNTIRRIATLLKMKEPVCLHGAALHDIGKAHPEFQSKLHKDEFDAVELRAGAPIPLRHEIASILFLPAFPRHEWDALIEMVAAHHKSVKSLLPQIRGKGLLDLIETFGDDAVFMRHSQNWEQWYNDAIEILKVFDIRTSYFTINEAREAFDYSIDYCQNVKIRFSEWRGLLNMADHFASAFGAASEVMAKKLFLPPDLGFFFADNRKNKLYPLSVIDAGDPRPHTLVSAPTGAGKTDFLIKRCHKRIFYILPFQASINAMYRRLKAACPLDDIRLQHASGRLAVTGDNITEEKLLQSFAGASIKILTPYQIASIVFGTKGYEAIAMDLKDNDVVLDEIHCYNNSAMALVYEMIRALLMLNCRVHVGTATMPSPLRKAILTLMGGADNVCSIYLDTETLTTFNRHIINKINSDEEAFCIIEESLKEKNKILFIVNRIQRAQEIYEAIKLRFPDTVKLLLHSRFKRKDRIRLEESVTDTLDKTPGPCIVVSTQVVEVSLDISFDIMITDAAPLDALIQRFGRINRRRAADTIGVFKHVYLLPAPEKANDALPYNHDVVNISAAVLPKNGLLHECSVQDMLDKVYPDFMPGSIRSQSIIDENGFRLPALHDYPKSVFLESLNIESASAVTESDSEYYSRASSEERAAVEIPLSPKAVFQKGFVKLGRIETGSWPFIVPDLNYNSELGLLLKELSNIL